MKALVVAEHDNQVIKAATLAALSAAMQLADRIFVLIAGQESESLAKQIKHHDKIEKVIVVDSPSYRHQFAEDVAALVANLAPDYDYVLVPATMFGKNVLPRASALCDCVMVSDVIKIIDSNTFSRPTYAGNVVETVRLDEKIKFLSVRPSAYQHFIWESEQASPVEKLPDPVQHLNQVEFLTQELTVMTRPELQNARVVVSGGRGLQSKENFKYIEELADTIGGAVGASRAAVDAGYISNDCQVGQTGKIVAPDLYIAVAISGAIQHLAGMKDSKVVVAINKDPDAPIFQVADYGLVGDLFELVPELTKALKGA